MDEKKIVMLIIIGILLMLLMILIIIKGINKNIQLYNNNKKYIFEQKDFIVILKITNLEVSKRFYSYTYQSLITVKSIDNDDMYDLYVESYDANLLEVNEEYKITHDGVVLLDYHKSIVC